MGLLQRIFRYCLILLLASLFFNASASGQQATGTLRGRVLDQLEAAIVGANVTIVGIDSEKAVTSNGQGEYIVSGLKPGTYTVRSNAPGFAVFEQRNVEISAGRTHTLDIKLVVTIDSQQVDVDERKGTLSTDPGSNAGAIVLSGTDLEILPDDPDDMAGALRAMAGPPAGPNGVQFTVDGFTNTGQPLPSRETIREVRINQNPFSAENDRLGFGLVQIFTRPGTDKLHGDASLNFSDESLNSRNPFAPTRAPYQMRIYNASVSRALVPKKASFFVSFNRREADENAFVNATVLDSALRITPLQLTVLTPQRRTSINPRVDFQLNPKHQFTVRYSYFTSTSENFGVGGFSLPERAYDTTITIHTLQFTETAILNTSTVNEFRLQFIPEDRIDAGDISRPITEVQQAFISGAPAVGPSSNPERRLWLQDTVTWIKNNHTFRAGGRLRRSTIKDVSPTNFGGKFTFGGGVGPELDANDSPVLDSQGNFVIIPISSIERYRRTQVFLGQGLPASTIRLLGGGASQFSRAGGNPEARATQIDFGAFIQDDWKLRPSLTLSLGLRYDTQTNVKSTLNLGPRVAFAWSPGLQGNQAPKTVVRGGFGVFYDRFAEGLVIDANRYNGINQQQFVTFDPNVLNLFPVAPTVEQLEASSQIPQTRLRIDPELRLPYLMQSGISVERQLPYRTTVTVNFVNTRMLHVLRSRNINAPVPGTFIPGLPGSGVRPLGDIGDLFQYESSGRFNQNQLIVNLNSRLNPKYTVFANYTLNRARSDTDGVGTFPANSYDLTTEYGRSSSDIRHFFFLGGNFEAPHGVRISPLFVAFSGGPFNITTGRDTNGDLRFTERPALATDLSKPGVIMTPFGAFDPNPAPGQALIPRNFGNSSGFFNIFLTVSKTFKFGTMPGNPVASQQSRPPAAAGAARSAPAPAPEKRYGLTLSLRVQNLFNHANLASPVGNLSSSFFGEPTATAGSFGFTNNVPSVGNRRVEGVVRLTF